MSEIIIGVDGSERGEDAVAFGRRLAAFAGARVVLANAFPYEDMRGRATSLAYREALREESEKLLSAVRERYGLEASIRTFPSTSPARALHEIAKNDCAALVVVGSSHVGRGAARAAGQHRRAAAARLPLRRRGRAEGLSRRGTRRAQADRLRDRWQR
jgi:nucleotide-binding universal stress UspA family protein